MAAKNTTSSSSRVNYYNIAYGALSIKEKKVPEGYEEIKLSDLKTKSENVEKIDLRKKYYDIENGKEYHYRVFYSDITGNIQKIEKEEYDRGYQLRVTLKDSDGDTSILQTPFYGKVSSDFLNRLLNVNFENLLDFVPLVGPIFLSKQPSMLDFLVSFQHHILISGLDLDSLIYF